MTNRFDAVERAVHWTTAALVGICFATAAALSITPIAALVGRRDLMKNVHVAAGLLLLVPFAVAAVAPCGARLRADVRALDRFDAFDRAWLRPFGRRRLRAMQRRGKFHPGQKLNAAATAAALVALSATGPVLRWFDPFPLDIRRGATFVHDWTAFLFAILIVGHVWHAARSNTPGELGPVPAEVLDRGA